MRLGHKHESCNDVLNDSAPLADSQLSRSVAEANSSDQRLSKIYLIFGQIET